MVGVEHATALMAVVIGIIALGAALCGIYLLWVLVHQARRHAGAIRELEERRNARPRKTLGGALASPVERPPYVCRFCGAPSWYEPADQSPPPDYCHPEDHGSPDLWEEDHE